MTANDRKIIEPLKLALKKKASDIGFESKMLYNSPYSIYLESEDLRWSLWMQELKKWVDDTYHIRIVDDALPGNYGIDMKNIYCNFIFVYSKNGDSIHRLRSVTQNSSTYEEALYLDLDFTVDHIKTKLK